MTTVQKGLRAVAILEACKGLTSLVVAIGIHSLAGDNFRELAEAIVSHFHLNPANKLPSVFIHAVSNLTDANVRLLAIGALVYSVINLAEAYGLWRGLRWIQWFTLISGSIYFPLEIYEIIFNTSLLAVGALLINIGTVSYMSYSLFSVKKQKKQPNV